MIPFTRSLWITICFLNVNILITTKLFSSENIELFRFKNKISHLKLSPMGRYLSFKEESPNGTSILKMVEIQTRNIFNISDEQVGQSFLWAPHGYRILYRIQKIQASAPEKTVSIIKVYDAVLHKNIVLKTIPSKTGFLNLNSRDLRLRIMAPKKIFVHKITYPGSRLAMWQSSQESSEAWLANQNGIIWIKNRGLKIKKLPDDNSPVDSFSVSPDGATIAWGTKLGKIYTSNQGSDPVFIGYGKHPSFHPKQKLLVYSGARMVGNVAVHFDLRISNLKGQGRWLTHTQHSDEIWPIWHRKKTMILFTIDNTSDLFLRSIKHEHINSKKYSYLK